MIPKSYAVKRPSLDSQVDYTPKQDEAKYSESTEIKYIIATKQLKG